MLDYAQQPLNFEIKCWGKNRVKNRVVWPGPNIQSLLFMQIISEINHNHIEVSMVMRMNHSNEVVVWGPVTIHPFLTKNTKLVFGSFTYMALHRCRIMKWNYPQLCPFSTRRIRSRRAIFFEYTHAPFLQTIFHLDEKFSFAYSWFEDDAPIQFMSSSSTDLSHPLIYPPSSK